MSKALVVVKIPVDLVSVNQFDLECLRFRSTCKNAIMSVPIFQISYTTFILPDKAEISYSPIDPV
ncbi:hypothetical protein ACTXT7_002803 [Hymenolepis weldensis]